jgi:hypothetical protein
MDPDFHERVIARLQHLLQALAMPPDVQLALLPDFVCKADELAMDFGEMYMVVRGNFPDDFTPDQ